MQTLEIGSEPLSSQDVSEVVFKSRKVCLSKIAEKKVLESHTFLLSEMTQGKVIYGVNTGFGQLANVKIPDHQIVELQTNLLRSHAVGVGSYLEDSYVRAILLLRANTLAQGYSGVRVEVVEKLLELLNHGVCPLIPEQGSVGASGDLAPLAHLALVLIGEGRARINSEVMSGAQALKKIDLQPLTLGPKEGLALVNGTQFMTALGILNLIQAEYLCDLADLTGAMSLEAMRGSIGPFEKNIHLLKPHPGQLLSAERLWKILGAGEKSEIAKSHTHCSKVQDPYSLRCMPQVHGACRDALTFVRSVLLRELNSVTDNPLIFASEKKILSGGNFHGEGVAMALDMLSVASAEIASISEQRIEKLMNPATSELPAFLIKEGGLNSGFMIVQVAAASLVSENKTLCHPASVDSIATSADKEDHVSMGAWAARKSLRVVENTRRVLAMELLCAAQGLDLLRPLKSTDTIEKLHAQVRKAAPYIERDLSMHDALRELERMITEREFYL